MKLPMTTTFDRISQSDAESHVQDLCQDLIGARTTIIEEQRQKMVNAGNQWGLEKEQVYAIIRNVIERNRELVAPSKGLSPTLVALFGAVAIGLTITFVAFRFFTPPIPVKPTTETTDTIPVAEKTNVFAQPEWWPGELYTAATSLSESNPPLHAQIKQIASESPEARLDGYKGVAGLVTSSTSSDEKVIADTAALFGRLLNTEPNEEIRSSILDWIMTRLAIPHDRMVGNSGIVKYLTQVNQLAFALWEHADEGTYRTTINERILDAIAVSPAEDPSNYFTLSTISIGNQLLSHVNQFAWTDPSNAAKVAEAIHEQLGDEVNRSIQSKAVLSVLSANPDSWTLLQDPRVHCH